MKTVLDTGVEFADVLNFNYKFRDIQSKIGHPKEYDNIKIQTQKFDNMQRFSEFLGQLTGNYNVEKIYMLDMFSNTIMLNECQYYILKI